MIQFIYGTAGTGKTELVYERLLAAARAGQRVILLVPEQQVLSCETALAARTGTGVPLGVEVLSFRRLANTVFRAEGGLRYEYLSRGQRTVLLWRAMTGVLPVMKKYGEVTLRDRGFLSEAVAAIDEFKAYRIAPADLERAAGELTEAQHALADKLNDLSVIYAAYNAALTDGFNDPADDLEALVGILETSDFLRPYQVYIDSFNGFTAVELEIVRLIFAHAQGCTVTSCYTDDSIMTASLALTDMHLRRAASESGEDIAPDIRLTEPYRFRHGCLSYLEENLWDFSAPAYTGDAAPVRIAHAHDIYAEAEWIARDIHARVRAGARYRDFAVIVRDLTGYTGILDAVFEKYGLPCFLSQRTDIALTPQVKCILGALAIHISGWRTDDVLSYIKCGITGITADECNRLENYVQTWGISGRRWHDEYEWNMNPAGYSEIISEEDTALLTELNTLRTRITAPLIRFFDCFGQDTTVGDATRALWGLIEELDIKSSVADTGADAAQIWNALLGALDALVHCAGEAKVSAELYRDLLLTVLSDADIGRIPAGNDQITVGDAALLRLHEVEHIYVAGVLEGAFPKAAATPSLLSDGEKKTLAALGVTLGADTERKNAEELFYFWRALCAPRDTLTLTYPCSTLAGKALSPSIGITRVRKLLPKVCVIDCDAIPHIDRAESYESAFEVASQLRGTPLGQALLDIYARDPAYAGRLRAIDTPLTDADASLSPQTANEVFARDLTLSQTQIKDFNECEFSYHCKYILKLREQHTPDFGNLDIGNFIHMLLERFMSRACASGTLDTGLTEAQIAQIVDELTDEYIAHVFRNTRAASARLLTLIGRLKRTARLLIAHILEQFRQSDFRPEFFELEIANAPDAVAPYTVTMPDGSTLRLRGKIDRVDTYRRGDEVFLRIVDYKLSSKEISVANLVQGKEIQMMLYLFALWKTTDQKFLSRLGTTAGKVHPAGVEYFTTSLPTVTFDRHADEQEVIDAIGEKIKTSALTVDDPELMHALNHERSYSKKELLSLERMGELLTSIEQTVGEIGCRIKSGSATVEWRGDRSKPCRYCAMRPVCRKER